MKLCEPTACRWCGAEQATHENLFRACPRFQSWGRQPTKGSPPRASGFEGSGRCAGARGQARG
eukprot:10846716-Alexandrium_andersonii.AAC.1